MKQIYGIDLSQKKFDVCTLSSAQKEKHSIVKNNFNGIVSFLESIPKNSLICCEHTGVYGDLMLFLANQMGIEIVFVPGYEIRYSLGLRKGKTDKIDAKKILEYCIRFNDKLKITKFLEEDIHELREIFRLRMQLVKERKMLLTHEKGKKHQAFNSIKVSRSIQSVLEILSTTIKDLEKDIEMLITNRQELKRNYELITSIKGIGSITACDLIVKTGNFRTLDSHRKAASYAGVCPFPNSSGKMVKKARVSSMADKELKSLLFLCSLVAVRANPEYNLYFQRKKLEGKPYFLIMNNIANKLLRTVYSIVESGEKYTLNYECKDPRNVA